MRYLHRGTIKSVLVAAVLICSVFGLTAAQNGVLSFRAISCYNGISSGRFAWSNVASATQPSGNYASINLRGGEQSQDLNCTFAVALPPYAKIRGLGIGQSSVTNGAVQKVTQAWVRSDGAFFHENSTSYNYPKGTIGKLVYSTTPLDLTALSNWGIPNTTTEADLSAGITLSSVIGAQAGASTYMINNVTLTVYYAVSSCGTPECNSSAPLGCDLTNCLCDTLAGWAHSGTGLGCVPVCGDDILAGGEQCELGYQGCSSSCTCDQSQGFYQNNATATKYCVPICGDFIVANGTSEECEASGYGCVGCKCGASFVSTNSVSCALSGDCQGPWPSPDFVCMSGVWTLTGGNYTIDTLNISSTTIAISNGTHLTVGTIISDGSTAIVLLNGSSLIVSNTTTIKNISLDQSSTVTVSDGDVHLYNVTVTVGTTTTGKTTPLFTSTSGCVDAIAGSTQVVVTLTGATTPKVEVPFISQDQSCPAVNPTVIVNTDEPCKVYSYGGAEQSKTDPRLFSLVFSLDQTDCLATGAAPVQAAPSNVAAIAGGVTAGVVIIAIILGAVFYRSKSTRLRRDRHATRRMLRQKNGESVQMTEVKSEQ